jgi:uncharacterized protein
MIGSMNKDANYWINKLKLQEHPEGGYFVETFRSPRIINLDDYEGNRFTCTAIYYLLPGNQFSAFHRMKSDEIWHFYTGSSLTLYVIHSNGTLDEICMGQNLDNNEIFQHVIESGCWFAAIGNDPYSYSLIGCTVSPGFDYRDWELANIDILLNIYPQHKSIIEKFR